MGRAIVTFGVGAHREMLDLALPAFREYADRHGYELLTCDDIPAWRPVAWFKIAAILEALESHDEVLWLDADIAILDTTTDVADEVPDDAWQALCFHQVPEGEIANTGVWLARRPMIPVLKQAWQMTRYLHHRWWEQAAVCHLLGYDPAVLPVMRQVETEVYSRTYRLGNEWNSHRDDEAEHPRFWHATVRGDRVQLMRELLEAARV